MKNETVDPKTVFKTVKGVWFFINMVFGLGFMENPFLFWKS